MRSISEKGSPSLGAPDDLRCFVNLDQSAMSPSPPFPNPDSKTIATSVPFRFFAEGSGSTKPAGFRNNVVRGGAMGDSPNIP